MWDSRTLWKFGGVDCVVPLTDALISLETVGPAQLFRFSCQLRQKQSWLSNEAGQQETDCQDRCRHLHTGMHGTVLWADVVDFHGATPES